jgi:lipid-binding SYLF domain-containing protein
MVKRNAVESGRISRRLAAALVVAAVAFAGAPAQAAGDGEAKLVSQATQTFERMRSDSGFRRGNDILHRAAAVIVVPQLTKGAIIFGGEAGDGILLARTAAGWSYPAFYTIGSASVGLQIGFQQAEVVIFVMTRQALDQVMNAQVTFGGKAGLSALFVGDATEDQLTKPDTDFIIWAKSNGAYAGITAEGSFVKPNDGANQNYYGTPLSALQIVQGNVRAPGADRLRNELMAR